MKVLVTGGAGFIGSVLVPQLLADGHIVTVLDDFRYEQTGLAAHCMDEDLAIVRGDARDYRDLEPLATRNDVVIPLAAVVGAPACDRDPEGATTTNFGAIKKLCTLLSKEQMIVYPNTNSGYGIGGEEACTEDSPLQPVSLYGRTKVDAEEVVMGRDNSIAFRLATVFGVSPRMRTDLLVNDFVLRAVTEGSVELYEAHARRNFVHIADVANAFSHALDHFGGMRGRVYNCGDSRANMTKQQLCAKISRHVRGFSMREVDGRDPDQRDYIVLNDRLMAAGWLPGVSIDRGIEELIKFYTMTGTRRFGNV